MAKELNHQAYPILKQKTEAALINWFTYEVGEEEYYFARYDRWGALVGFNESFGSYKFTDNHFHYGYFTLAAALYGMAEPSFLDEYGDIVTLIAKQYANWDRNDEAFPFLRTFDPWIGHSYAGGTSSVIGNNQESTSEAMQSWIGLFLLGDMLDNEEMRDTGAFGYMSESYATLEYWFDWENRNLPEDYEDSMVGILSNQGFAYATYFSASPVHIHGIQYLPVNPGFKYLARNSTWATQEYNNMLTESQAFDGHESEADFGNDWGHVALGFRQLFDPEYVSAFMDNNLALDPTDENRIMNYEISGLTYFYTHANQNLGDFTEDFYTDFPISSVFTENGAFSYAVAYNPTESEKTCTIYNSSNGVVDTFTVPAQTLITYPTLPLEGQNPDDCYNLLPVSATATSGNANQAIDANMGTRWESDFADPHSITLELVDISMINEVELIWEVANAKNYTLQGSVDGIDWETIIVQTDMPTGNRTDNITGIDAEYKFLKMEGTERNTPYGYSIFEFNICGGAAESNLGLNNNLQQDNSSFSIYPNPASNNITISGKTTGDAELFDITGKLLKTFEVNQNNTTVQIDNLASGVYFVRFNNTTQRLIIE
jgi:hypothetical protein